MVALLPLAGGCYYAHLAAGQARLLWEQRPVDELLSDPRTPAHLRERLALAQRVRAYAEALGLAVGNRYTSYVPAQGRADRVLTTVVATPPASLEPRAFWFPVAGRVPYKGFFDAARARREAERLATEGLDTCRVPVPAYSTLGWIDDPLTAPMLRGSEARVAELLLHELLHATVYVPGAPDFNEGLATFVGRRGAVRFFERAEGAESEAARRARLRAADAGRIDAALAAFREAVAALYAEELAPPERRRRRAALERAARARVAALPLRTRDAAALARGLRLNDACQALAGTYRDDLGAYATRLEALDGDLAQLVRAASEAARAEDPRRALLDGAARTAAETPPRAEPRAPASLPSGATPAAPEGTSGGAALEPAEG